MTHSVSARPAIYIDVIINGQKHIYDVTTVRILRDQITLALSALESLPPQPDDRNASDVVQCEPRDPALEGADEQQPALASVSPHPA